MKRSHLFLAISGACALLVAGSLVLNGCTAQTEPYSVQQFATLRIMNFAPSDASCNPTAPMDIYWDTKTPVSVSGNNAKIYNLKYGDAAVYTTSLAAATGGTTYHIVATPTRIPGKAWITDDETLYPASASNTGKYTYIITLNPSTPDNFQRTLIPDGVPNASPESTYVRFINMQANAGPLTVRVNDPVTGQAINSTPLDFNQVGSYTALHYVQDTSFAFFVVNASNQVLARLSYQTFIGGSSYTLVYAGDPCQTVLNNPADTTTSALDTLRLRAFDDNTTGNDQTNPILYSYRYNIVNDIYPDTAYGALGFLNGQAFSAHFGFSINPVPALQAGGAYSDPGNGVYNVYYQSTALTDPLDVKVFSTTPTGGNSTLVYDYNLPAPQTSVPMDKPVTFLFTGPDTALKNGTYWNNAGRILQVPDVSSPNTVTLAFYNATNASYKVAGTALYASFYVSGPGYDSTISNISSNNRSTMSIIQVPLSSSGSFTIADSIGTGSNKGPGDSKTFTADPGAIYEVFAVGIKSDPHLLIMRVNGNQ